MVNDKQKNLINFIRKYNSALVAFSGGLDSSLVLWAAIQTLGADNVIAVTSLSESYASGEMESAREIAIELGLSKKNHITINTREIENENYAKNPTDRCYWCKHTLFSDLTEIARENGKEVIFDGSNLSDLGDFRPGQKAVSELKVVSPLKEAGLTKDDIREIARINNLSFSEKPAAACLASRIPYGTTITPERLRMVDLAETAVREAGFEGFRVRYHHDVARLELRPEDIPRLIQDGAKEKIVEKIKSAGFKYVALDLEGYRMGSMNEVIDKGENNDG